MKVHEIAKQLNVTSKEILNFLKGEKISVKSHLSVLDDNAIGLLHNQFSSQGTVAKDDVKEKATTQEKTKKKKTKSETVANASLQQKEITKKKKIKTVEKKGPTRRRRVKEEKHPEVVSPRRKTPSPRPECINIKIPITVGSLATNLTVKTSALIKTLIEMRLFATVNQLLDEDTVMKVAKKFNVEIKKIPSQEEKLVREHERTDDESQLQIRPPVVTMMGHVDHGKTSLLDAIRKSRVVDREAGKITQHIGAYEVTIPNKGMVTFLDTPGHSAFTAMRARGANITDIVILVVAADDGVMPQTIEAINHARAADTPIVVAINKTDLPNANPDKVKAELKKHDLTAEEWGGKTIMVNVSAKTGKGIDELLELLLLEAEILELKGNPDRLAQGTVIEGKLSKSLGSVANVLIQNGTLHVGNILVCGRFHGKIRALRNDKGKNVQEASISMPIEVLGINGVPEAGEKFYVVNDERQARYITEKRLLDLKERSLSGGGVRHLTLEGLYDKIKESGIKELKIIIKADVQGSVEVLKQSLEKLSTEKIKLKVIHGGAGGISESDVILAAASDAIIIGFHVKADSKAQSLLEREKVDFKYYKIIYEAINDVRLAMEGLLEPTIREVVLGKAVIQQLFKASKLGNIAGCVVKKGRLVRNQRVRLIRDNVVIYEGALNSLKRFKDDAREVSEGYECGIVLAKYNDIKAGDVIECFKEEKVATKL
ncbi:MAG: translation initiation factor IF-2 [Candidatus Omnitrophica bacterium]|nr:translation initiation factor IF-2 [Candidatus Omnitrophota bacterium]